jgi:Zn-dependent protease with chaperone function
VAADRDLLSALGWGVLHAVWVGTLVAGWTAATLRLLPAAPSTSRHALALGALLAMAGAVPLGALAAPGHEAAWMQWLGGGWLAGVVVLGVRLLHALTLVRDLRRRSRPMTAPWPQRLRQVAAMLGIRRAVDLAESDDIEAPCSIGAWRPAVLLPADATAGLGPVAFDAILAHELGHVRRHDYGWNLLQQVLEALLFFHPARPWLSRVIARERERSCDAIASAVTTPMALARGLARLEARRQGTSNSEAGDAHTSLLDRVQDLLDADAAPAMVARSAGTRWAVLAASLVGIAGSIALTVVGTFASTVVGTFASTFVGTSVAPP